MYIAPTHDWRRLAACWGKAAHATAAGAHAVMKRMIRRHKHKIERHRRLTVYRCQHCSQWHIGGTDVAS